MKFYMVSNDVGETLGCELTLSRAVQLAADYGLKRDEAKIDAIDVPVTAETVRRLLGGSGGYARSIRRVRP
jgi:hypothetical protein